MTNYYVTDKADYVEEIRKLYDNIGENFTVENFLSMVVGLLADAYEEGELEGYTDGFDKGYKKGYSTCELDLDDEGEF